MWREFHGPLASSAQGTDLDHYRLLSPRAFRNRIKWYGTASRSHAYTH